MFDQVRRKILSKQNMENIFHDKSDDIIHIDSFNVKLGQSQRILDFQNNNTTPHILEQRKYYIFQKNIN